jgi:malate synthase
MAATKNIRPEALAQEIGISGKVLRAWLRKEHPRAKEQKNTAWLITPAVATEARKAFKKNETPEKKAEPAKA